MPGVPLPVRETMNARSHAKGLCECRSGQMSHPRGIRSSSTQDAAFTYVLKTDSKGKKDHSIHKDEHQTRQGISNTKQSEYSTCLGLSREEDNEN